MLHRTVERPLLSGLLCCSTRVFVTAVLMSPELLLVHGHFMSCCVSFLNGFVMLERRGRNLLRYVLGEAK